MEVPQSLGIDLLRYADAHYAKIGFAFADIQIWLNEFPKVTNQIESLNDNDDGIFGLCWRDSMPG